MIRPSLRTLAWGWLFGVGTVAILGAIYVALVLAGITFDTSATTQHSKLFAWGVHNTMNNSVRRRAPIDAPRLPFDDATLLAGARNYETNCVACHGGPGVARARWVSAMLPTPPYLLDMPKHFSYAELYTLVHDGVKMTGMPAWGEVQSDREVAEVVAFLEAMPRMTPSQFDAWRRRARAQSLPDTMR